MKAQIGLTCHAPFVREANIGAQSIRIKRVCFCGPVPIEPMPAAIHQLSAIREFEAVTC